MGLKEWLKTIPIGNGAERGWDDTQILEIAEFAQEQHLEHLTAEEIYKRYVEYQVEKSGGRSKCMTGQTTVHSSFSLFFDHGIRLCRVCLHSNECTVVNAFSRSLPE